MISQPLHPEFRTLPCLFYIPPESPVLTALGDGHLNMVNGRGVLPDLDQFRIPIRFLTRLLGAGNEEVVRVALLRQLAVRAFRRSERGERTPNADGSKAGGVTTPE